jgi:putative membrane protein
MVNDTGAERTCRDDRTLKDYAGIAGVGVAMGAADIVPGVSGGTMAFIFGIYEELLASIKSFNLQLLRLLFAFRIKEGLEHVNWKFLVSLGGGLGGAFMTLAHLISWLLDHHPVPLFAFFFGLVLASIVAVSTHVRWNIPMFIACVAGTGVAYFLVRMVPMDMPNDPFTLFWCSGIAIMAMLLPGISGSFLLFMLGQYKYILDAVKSLDVITLLPVVAGIAVGVMLFSRVLTWLLKRHHQVTITLLVGFMIGSLWKIWPFRMVLETATKPNGEIIPIREAVVLPDLGSGLFWLSLGLCALGFVVISVLDHLQSKANPLMRILGR